MIFPSHFSQYARAFFLGILFLREIPTVAHPLSLGEKNFIYQITPLYYQKLK